MSVVMMFAGGVPVIKIGRIAGQFAKPRSADMEEIVRFGQLHPAPEGSVSDVQQLRT